MDYINHGVILGPRKPKDWIHGGIVGSELKELNPTGQWLQYLPDFEAQNKMMETMGCVSYSALNCLEILSDFHNTTVNFSDRFLAKMSGTTKQGNSFLTVADTIRTVGLVMEDVWPWPALPTDWDVYYAAIPDEVKAKAQKIAGYSWRWAETDETSLKDALRFAPIQVCNDYHAFVIVGYDSNGWLTFDTYGNGKGRLPYSYKLVAAMLHSFDYSDHNFMTDIKDNSLVVITDTGERLMKIGERLYADDAGKIITELTARNAKDGVSNSIPVWHGTSATFDNVIRYGLNGIARYRYDKGIRLEIATFTAGADVPAEPLFTKEQAIKVAKGAAIAMGAAAFTALCQYALGIDFGKYNPMVQALVGIGLNFIKVISKF